MKSKMDWTAINAEWELSKLSQEAFCESKQINHSTFVYHRGKILGKHKQSDHSKFASIRLNHLTSPSTCSELRLHLPNGIRLDIPSSFSHSQLKQVLTLLGIVLC